METLLQTEDLGGERRQVIAAAQEECEGCGGFETGHQMEDAAAARAEQLTECQIAWT